MRIGIDGNLLCGKRTGMGTAAYQVLMHYNNSRNPDTEIILYLTEPADQEFTLRMEQNAIQIRVLGKSNYILWEQFVLPRQAKRDRLDVMWFPYNTGSLNCPCKMIVTIHDVIYMKNKMSNQPTLYKKLGQLYRKLVVPRAAKKAEKVITDTEYARTEIIDSLRLPADKLETVYLGAEPPSRFLTEEEWTDFAARTGIAAGYILGFGSLEKRKNSLRVIRAFHALLAEEKYQNLQLVLFGFRGFESSEEFEYIRKHQLEQVLLLAYVSEEEKNSLYAHAKMFLFPSLAEGFGIPVLEAFANHTPVITSNTTSLPEVAGDAAIQIDPESESELIAAMRAVLDDPEKRRQMAEAGEYRLLQFDWNQTAHQIFTILHEQQNG